MPTMEDASKLDALFSMFKGEPGLRKSTQALSYPTDQYWFSTDQKMEALTLPMKRWGINPRSIHYDDYTDWNKAEAKMKALQVNCPYKTIIVDSITSSGDTMTRQVKKQKNASGDGKMIGGIPVSGLEEFNAESNAFQEMLALLKDIHKFHHVNIILIAHVLGVRKDNDANKMTHHSRVIVTGAERIGAKIASYMTEVYHFNIRQEFEANKEGQYGLLTIHTGNDYARTSLPLPSEVIFNSQPLYETVIKPAIERLKAEKPIERIPTNPTSQQPTTPQQPSTTKPF